MVKLQRKSIVLIVAVAVALLLTLRLWIMLPADPPAPITRFDPAKLTLTLAWNQQTYNVPAPALVPEQWAQSKEYRRWWRTGDARKFAWTAPDGKRYVIEAFSRIKLADGSLKPMIPFVSRIRADGTLETKTILDHEGPAQWWVYAPDGQTPLVEVTNRQHGLPGTPFIQYVRFYAPTGKVEREYQANQQGVAYLEWFYNEAGQLVRFNGSRKLDITPAK